MSSFLWWANFDRVKYARCNIEKYISEHINYFVESNCELYSSVVAKLIRMRCVYKYLWHSLMVRVHSDLRFEPVLDHQLITAYGNPNVTS